MEIISSRESQNGGGNGCGGSSGPPTSTNTNNICSNSAINPNTNLNTNTTTDTTNNNSTNTFWAGEIPNQHLNIISEDIIIRVAALKELENCNEKKISVTSLPNSAFKPEKNGLDNNDNNGPPHRKQKISRQIIASIAANMGAFNFGTVMAWSATGLASLHESGDLGEISLQEGSWIGSVALLGAVAACPFAGFGLVNFGRRKTMLYLTPLFVIGWLLIAFSNHLWMIFLGRFITGLCGGAFSVSAPIFTAETSDANIRGGLGSFFDLLLSVGMLYIYVIGRYANWRWQALACGVMPLVFHLMMYFIPESPRYLVEKEKVEKAQKAIRWLKKARKYPEFVQWEFSELSKSVEQGRDQQFTFRDTLRRPIVRPTLILIGIMFFTTLSGVDAVVAYTVEIFESAGAEMDPKMCTIIIGLTQVLSTIPAALIVDHLGRRLLLMVSSIFMCLSLVVMGFYFHVKRFDLIIFGMDHDGLSWMPLGSLIAFVISYSFGFGPLSMMMIGEVLPNHMKGATSCIVLMARWLMAFTVTYTFEEVKERLHDDKTYWMFAGICFAGIFYVYYCIPETKGKSLDEIQIYFVNPKKLDKITLNNALALPPCPDSLKKESLKDESHLPGRHTYTKRT